MILTLEFTATRHQVVACKSPYQALKTSLAMIAVESKGEN
jgi:hypothetical protein